MGWLDWFRPRTEQRTITLADFPSLSQYLTDPIGTVNERTAMNVSSYWNGVDVIASQVAVLPRILYRRTENDSRERASSHPAYRILHDQPNSFTVPFVFWQTLMSHCLTWGNGYASIEFDNASRPIAMWLIPPDQIYPEVRGSREDQRIVYRYRGKEDIEAEDIIHIPGLGFDGIQGYSVVHMARRALGLAIATETFGASFFSNGAWPGLVLEHPGKMSQPAQERFLASIQSRHVGSGKAHRPFIAEEGMKANKIGIPPEDAQFLETREFQVVEIARILNLPTWKLKIQQDARPGGNPETSQIEFLTDTLAPWLVRIEQECNRKLIPASQRGTFYMEHLVDGILRMDSATRAGVYKTYVGLGVMSPEQVAKKENLPPPPKKPVPLAAKPGPVPAEDPPQRMADAVRALCVELVARFIRREGEMARRASKKVDGFSAWVEEFYSSEGDELARYLQHGVELQLAVCGSDGDAKSIARELTEDYVSRSKEELLDLPKTGLQEHVIRLVEGWQLMRAHELAEQIAAIGPREEIHG